MRKVFGHSIPEYALILALVVLISIPAVQILGQVISGGLFQQGAEAASGASQLMSFISPNAAGGASSVSGYDGSSQSLMNLWKQGAESGNAPRVWRDESGNFKLGTATNATSVDGGSDIVRTMADSMSQFIAFLQENGAEDLGLDPALLLNIEKLAQQGHQLGFAMDAFNNASEIEKKEMGQYEMVDDCWFFSCAKARDLRAEAHVRSDVWDNYQQFGTQYEEVSRLIAQVPDDHPLKADLEAYLRQHSNVITNVAYSNYVQEYNLGAKQEVKQSQSCFLFICGSVKKEYMPPTRTSSADRPLQSTGGAIAHDVTLAYSPPETHYRSDRIKAAEQEARRKRAEARQAEMALKAAQEEKRHLEEMANAGDESAAQALRDAERTERDAQRQLSQAEREVNKAERAVEREITQAEREAERAAREAERAASSQTGVTPAIE